MTELEKLKEDYNILKRNYDHAIEAIVKMRENNSNLIAKTMKYETEIAQLKRKQKLVIKDLA